MSDSFHTIRGFGSIRSGLTSAAVVLRTRCVLNQGHHEREYRDAKHGVAEHHPLATRSEQVRFGDQGSDSDQAAPADLLAAAPAAGGNPRRTYSYANSHNGNVTLLRPQSAAGGATRNSFGASCARSFDQP